jgi:hypothetical protein
MDAPDAAEWSAAMRVEMQNMANHEVWVVAPPTPGMKILKAKWIFVRKFHQDGSLNKYKARLVAVGSSQRPGVDFEATQSPVVRTESVRMLLALAAARGYSVRTHDYVSAYLNSPISEVLGMRQPEGFVEGAAGDVCILRRSIYGTAQAARNWYITLKDSLLSIGLRQCTFDPCVFFEVTESGDLVALAYHVDDGICVGPEGALGDLLTRLKTRHDVEETRNTDYLGLHLTYSQDGIFIDQRKYVEKILQKYHMQSAKVCAFPALVDQDLDEPGESRDADKQIFQEMLGSALYLVNGTRPDIGFAVTNLARFSTNPKELHLNALKNVYRYLLGTKHLGLMFRYQCGVELSAESDASWGVTSFSGYLVRVGGNPIIWKVKKQKMVAMSSCEAELIAMTECTKEVLWARGMLEELCCQADKLQCTVLETDSQSAITIIGTVGMHGRSRHYRRLVVYLQNLVGREEIILKFKDGKTLTSDLLTKPFNGKSLERRISEFNLIGLRIEAVGSLATLYYTKSLIT